MKVFMKWLGIGVGFLIAVCVVLLAINFVLPPVWELGPEIILALAAAAVSLLFSYGKGVRLEFAALPPVAKSLINVFAVLIVAVLMFLLTCTKWLSLGFECSQTGLRTLLTYVAIALVINQATDRVSVDAPDVKELKASS